MVKQLSRAKLFIVIAIVIATVAGLIIFTRKPPPEPHGGGSSSTPQGSTSSVDSAGDSSPITQTPPPPTTVSVSINAIPWARVFIKLPENDYLVMEPRARDFTIPPEPNGRNSNVTPIPGDLKIPIGTTIKLMYRGKEKIFPYEAWKNGKSISHDFLNQ